VAADVACPAGLGVTVATFPPPGPLEICRKPPPLPTLVHTFSYRLLLLAFSQMLHKIDMKMYSHNFIDNFIDKDVI